MASESNNWSANGTLEVWLAIPNNVTPGTYQIKAAVGGFVDNVWTPQNPKINDSPATDFSDISGKYASNTFDISKGTGKCGDCNGDGTVTIDEVQKVINAFLGK